MNAVKCVYGIDITTYKVTDEEVGVKFNVEESGISTGTLTKPQTLLNASRALLKEGCNAIAIVCLFEEPEDDNPNYSQGLGVDPVGGVEAIISHYISKELQVPCAHSPAFVDYQIYPDLVDGKAASEYITPTFLPCILIGLNNAPIISTTEGISIDDLDYLVMPYDALGSTPVFEAIKRGIKIFAIKENSTELNVSASNISNKIIEIPTYKDCLDYIVKNC